MTIASGLLVPAPFKKYISHGPASSYSRSILGKINCAMLYVPGLVPLACVTGIAERYRTLQ